MFCRNSSKVTLELYYLTKIIGILYLYFHYTSWCCQDSFTIPAICFGITLSSCLGQLPTLCIIWLFYPDLAINSIHHLFLKIYETFSLHSTSICSNDAARKRWVSI